ncbi:hypothetical protein GCM10010439_52660 [Actinocorallia aurantiaca]|uniref:Uncharacterized protein n=1 Tax=Actinocorallia aurantiaca TaxID=46204 RepID=A0ABN3UHX5_9ACTN
MATGLRGAKATGATAAAEITTDSRLCSRYWWALCAPFIGVASGVDIRARAQAATVQLVPGVEPMARLQRFGRSASTAMIMPRAKKTSERGSRCSL